MRYENEKGGVCVLERMRNKQKQKEGCAGCQRRKKTERKRKIL